MIKKLLLLLSVTTQAHAAQISKDDNLIIVTGEITGNDYDNFKYLTSSLTGNYAVILNSPGGSLLASLQIGELIRLKGWKTVAPSICFSSCALIWLAGTQRYVTPTSKIGFHAASIGGQEKGLGNALVGAYLNKMGLDYNAIAFATMASPDDIQILTPEIAKNLNIGLTVVDPQYKQERAQKEANSIIKNLYENSSNNAQDFQNVYWDQTNYYGKMTSKSNVLIDKQNYFNRWPKRLYTLKTFTTNCKVHPQLTECTVEGIFDYQVENATRTAKGTASFIYTLRPYPFGYSDLKDKPDLRISLENGKVIKTP